MKIEVNPKETSRAQAYELWMKAPNPMVTFFKTIDVTRIVKVSKKRGLKFNMLLDILYTEDLDEFGRQYWSIPRRSLQRVRTEIYPTIAW